MNSLGLLNNLCLEGGIELYDYPLVLSKINKFTDKNIDISDVQYSVEETAGVIIDVLKLEESNFRSILDYFVSSKLQIGVRHKNILIRYLNYRDTDTLNNLLHEIQVDNDLSNIDSIRLLIETAPRITNADLLYLFKKSLSNVTDIDSYLYSIYSKLYIKYNTISKTNKTIYDNNMVYLKDSLSSESIEELELFCISSSDTSFYDKFLELLNRDLRIASLHGELEDEMNQNIEVPDLYDKTNITDRCGDLHYLLTESYDSVYLRLTQEVFDKFDNIDSFYDYVLDSVTQAYRILSNSKVFSVEIDNIYYNSKNIKWSLYSKIGIFAENFIRLKELRKFYSPFTLAKEMAGTYNIDLSYITDKELQDYYKGKTSNNNISDTLLSYLDIWKDVYYGFQFDDCRLICSDTGGYKLLLIFYKYRADDRNIPCPICSGLNVANNSYTEIGHRSWECRNAMCEGKSKSNRGKRFSVKTNYMQEGALSSDSDTIIPKAILKQWRRDISICNSDMDLYFMFIKYFSFPKERVLFINGCSDTLSSLDSYGRFIANISLLDTEGYYLENTRICVDSLYTTYFKSDTGYISRFIRNKLYVESKNINIEDIILNSEDNLIINGDCFEVLNSIPKGVISSVVTSPPYYNARDYAIWGNLYLYLIDMLGIIKGLYTVLDDKGVVLYNVGDISGNENTITKSNMGNKKIQLGAYSILLFEVAGFELVENYIWNKGEPQSKRNTNGGNLTPHYQKPINCYEHMLLFKKRGIDLDTIEIPSDWESGIVDITPVLKISADGRNKVGHTAPYPENIPHFIAENYTREGMIVLDPFLGSGTSMIASARLGKRSVGIEYTTEYTKLSINRFEYELPNHKLTSINICKNT